MEAKTHILYNADIFTLDKRLPQAAALAIRDGVILAAGESQQVVSNFSENTQFTDLSGKTILPGLTDAHFHLMHYAFALQKVDCETSTRQECLERVARRAQAAQPGAWILGHGWNQNSWPEGFGSAADLDQIAPKNPVYLTAKSLHAGWANSAALKLAGLNANTLDPQGGQLGRTASGDLNGILYETAMYMVEKAIPETTAEAVTQAIQAALPTLWQVGLTGIHDFDGPRCFAALQTLQSRGQLGLRVIKNIPLANLDQAVGLGLRSGFGNDFLRIGSIKAFADGALGPRTAAMLQGYETNPDNRGMLMMDGEEFFEHGRKAMENGLSMTVHAIGDRANHEMLDGYKQLRAYEEQINPGSRLRHRIEHVQVLHPDDLNRLADLDIIASMQPIHATSDMLMANEHWGERTAHAYAWRELLNSGVHLAFGSDAPVESPNPFWGLHAAVTRQRQDDTPKGGWHPEQRLSLYEALEGFTTGAAYAGGVESRLGRLTAGYAADLIVLDKNPFSCPAEEIAGLKPSRTMLNGEWVYER